MNTNPLNNLKIIVTHLEKKVHRVLLYGILFIFIFNVHILITSGSENDIQWNLTLVISSETGKSDTVTIGEALTATDGMQYDNFDVPKPISPLTPYVRCWLDDNLNEPYNELWRDYRSYPDTQKIWEITVQWVPADHTSPTDITITWDKSLLQSSEYTSVNLYDNSGNTLRKMMNTNTYTFIAQAMTSYTFSIKAIKANSYSLTINTIGNGTGTVEIFPIGPYDEGEIVTVSANPSSNSTFTEWTGDLTGSETPQIIVMNSDKIVNAKFTLKCYTLEILKNGNGTVTINPIKGCYPHGTVIQLTATPDQGLSFASWSGDFFSDENPVTFIIEKNVSITATFGKIIHTLNISVIGEGSVIPPEGSHRHTDGTSIDIEALPASGWRFKEWSENLTGNSNPTTFTIHSNVSITATFEKKSSGSSSGDSGGSSTIELLPPVSITNGPFKGFAQENLSLDASQSYDIDGTITRYIWDLGDSTTGEGKTISHSYDTVGNYSITLTVTDNDGQTSTDFTYALIVSVANYPPSISRIDGPLNGTIKTMYSYNIIIQDSDDTTISCSIDWGDESIVKNVTCPSNEPLQINHQWERYGKYQIIVIAADAATTVSETFSVYIDTYLLPEDPIVNVSGYLFDVDSDDTYDTFYNSETGITNEIKSVNRSIYLIDTNLDGSWDLRYDIQNKQYTEYSGENIDSKEGQFLIIIFVISVIFLTALIGYGIHSSKKMMRKKLSSKKRTTQKR